MDKQEYCRDAESKGLSPSRTVVPYPSNQAQTIEFLREWVTYSSAIQNKSKSKIEESKVTNKHNWNNN